MPWFQSKAVGGAWGWHWTMSKFDPDRVVNGRPEIAARQHPLIGPYDSSDPDTLECQTLLIKMSGFDGLVIDWYGTDNVFDYAQINRNAERMAATADAAGLKVAIVFEDHTVAELIRQHVIEARQAIGHGQAVMAGLEARWFNRPNYLHRDGKPVFLIFGPQFYRDEDMASVFAHLSVTPAYFRLLDRKGPSIGGFGWPGPQPGEARSWTELDAFYARARSWPAYIAAVYPRFDDIYAQAGVHASWGAIGDHNGYTFRRTLDLALAGRPYAVQFATWNDWGEGTEIEPSAEYGFRDLETIQATRRRMKGGTLPFSAADLRLPIEIYRRRKESVKDPAAKKTLDRVVALLRAGHPDKARSLLSRP